MTVAEFWEHVHTLVIVYDGRVTEGPRSQFFDRMVDPDPPSKFTMGLKCTLELRDIADGPPLIITAARYNISGSIINEQHHLIHLEAN